MLEEALFELLGELFILKPSSFSVCSEVYADRRLENVVTVLYDIGFFILFAAPLFLLTDLKKYIDCLSKCLVCSLLATISLIRLGNSGIISVIFVWYINFSNSVSFSFPRSSFYWKSAVTPSIEPTNRIYR